MTKNQIIAEKDGSLTVNVNGGSVISSPPHIVNSGASAVNNEPVTIRYDFDGYGYQYIDSGSGSDWQTRVEGEPLYTHPAKTLTEWEMKECWEEATEGREHFCSQYFDFAQLILKKASEK
jgi:hypothetical protein